MINRTYLLAAVPALLSACGGGSDDAVAMMDTTPNIDPAEEALRIFSESAGDAGDVLSGTGTLTARSVSTTALHRNASTGETEMTDATVALRREGTELVLIVDGVEHVFTNGDRTDPSGYDGTFGPNSRNAGMGTIFREIDDYLTIGTGHAQIFAYSTSLVNDGDPEIRGFAVVGTETRDADIGSLGSATYSGEAGMELYPQTGYVSPSNSRTRVRGDVTMAIDLGSTTISGTIGNIIVREPGGSDTSVAGTISMDSAEFDVNAFAGTLSPDATLISNVGAFGEAGEATYSGAFYGAAGQEVGGALSFDGTDTNGVGYFYGTKN